MPAYKEGYAGRCQPGARWVGVAACPASEQDQRSEHAVVAQVDPGWAEYDAVERPTNVVDGCLNSLTISGEVAFPTKAVQVCKFIECGARSDHVGQLPCRGIKQ